MYSLARSETAFAVQNLKVREIFLSYYPNRLHTIFKTAGSQRWVTLNRKTKLPDELVLDSVACGTQAFRGVKFADKTRFAVLDIDSGSRYHNQQELQKLKKLFESIGLTKTKLFRSSISGGWHLYIPFTNWESSSDVSKNLRNFLKSEGYKIKCGELEVFPSRAGLRLPLQHGFAWLDDHADLVIEREEFTADEAISVFVHDIEDNINDWNYTKLCINEELFKTHEKQVPDGSSGHPDRVSTDGFDQLYTNYKIQENYEKGRLFWTNGIQEKKEIHDAILCIGHYLWFGDADASIPAYPGTWNDRSRERLIRQWLEENHRGLSDSINAGDWKIIEENIKRAVEWRGHTKPEREAYPITERVRERLIHLARKTGRLWHIDDLKHANENREKEAREKIKEAVELFEVEGRKLTIKGLAKESGCSINTIRKHSDLWLSKGSGVYNLGGGKDLGYSKEEKIENSNSKNSLDPSDNPKEREKVLPSENDSESSKFQVNGITVQRKKKKSLKDNFDSADGIDQLVIDLADWVSKKREGRGPP